MLVTKKVADRIVAGDYKYKNPLGIVKFKDQLNQVRYGAVFRDDQLNMYDESWLVRKPMLYWAYESFHIKRLEKRKKK